MNISPLLHQLPSSIFELTNELKNSSTLLGPQTISVQYAKVVAQTLLQITSFWYLFIIDNSHGSSIHSCNSLV